VVSTGLLYCPLFFEPKGTLVIKPIDKKSNYVKMEFLEIASLLRLALFI
jgi:hypothetical protein